MKMIVHIETNFGHIHVECDTLTQYEVLRRAAEETIREIEYGYQRLLTPWPDDDQEEAEDPEPETE